MLKHLILKAQIMKLNLESGPAHVETYTSKIELLKMGDKNWWFASII